MRKIRVLDNVYDLITINMEDRFKDNVAFRFYLSLIHISEPTRRS